MDIVLNEGQRAVVDDVKAGHSVLVTGGAGTGKTTLLNELRRDPEVHMDVTAATGVAAILIRGSTLHRFAGLGVGDHSAESIYARLADREAPALYNIKFCKTLAIDEVSMIDADMLDTVDRLFRLIRGRYETLPFGGVQVVFFGDFMQLPPVTKRGDTMRFAFESDVWMELNTKVHILNEVFRQQDEDFAAALRDIREGNLSERAKALLEECSQERDFGDEVPVRLYTKNDKVNAVNMQELSKIDGAVTRYAAQHTGKEWALDILEKNCLAPQMLYLKVGARVMLLQNISPENGLANGSMGVVTSLGENRIGVRFDCGVNHIFEERSVWAYEEGNNVLATRTQFPLRLAWAITIHKSQGMSLDKMVVNISTCWEPGQAYVALSRARTKEGLHIEGYREGAIKASKLALEFYRQQGAFGA